MDDCVPTPMPNRGTVNRAAILFTLNCLLGFFGVVLSAIYLLDTFAVSDAIREADAPQLANNLTIFLCVSVLALFFRLYVYIIDGGLNTRRFFAFGVHAMHASLVVLAVVDVRLGLFN